VTVAVLFQLLEEISRWTIPVMLAGIPLYGWWRGVRIYDAFIDGAREGLEMAVRIAPYLVSIFVALGVFRDSGALDLAVDVLRPWLDRWGVPGEVLPLALIRPFSGGGALGITAELLRRHGPDSYIGRLASTMQGSTDTTFYILSFYFGSVGIRNPRHAVAAGLSGDLAGIIASVIAVRWLFYS